MLGHVFNRARKLQHTTVGALRSLTLRDLAIDYGNMQGREVLDTLSRAGLTLQLPPTQTDLWHYGFLSPDQLVLPTDPSSPLWDYSPWIGNALVRRLQERGVDTIPQLAALLKTSEATSVPGIGRQTHEKLLSFLAQLEICRATGGRCPRLNEKRASALAVGPSRGTPGRTPTWLEAGPLALPKSTIGK
jgi:hypothetical protein